MKKLYIKPQVSSRELEPACIMAMSSAEPSFQSLSLGSDLTSGTEEAD